MSADTTLRQAALREAMDREPTDWPGAIDQLMAANRAARSDDIEIALAGLRHRSAGRLIAESEPNPLIAAGPSPSTGDAHLPERELDGLTAPDVVAAIRDRGCLLIRNAVAPDRARELADSIDQSFAARDVWSAALNNAAGDAPTSAWWSPLELDRVVAQALGRKWVTSAGGLLLCDSPRMMFELLELYTEMGLASVCADFLGTRPVLSANKCTLRRVPLDATGGWHQDGAFLGGGIRAINLWLALTPCGVDAPGLDIVARRFDHVVETGTGGSYFDWSAGADVVSDAAGTHGIVRPEFEAGDLLIFDDLLLHRTAVTPEMTKERHAIETWCFAASAYPGGQIPLVW